MFSSLTTAALRHTKVVVCVSSSRSRDGTHEHVSGLTLRAESGLEHHASAADVLAQLRQPLGERYLARSPETGQYVQVVAGVCPRCSNQTELWLGGAGQLLDLPRCR
jgi:hypothetical protein